MINLKIKEVTKMKYESPTFEKIVVEAEEILASGEIQENETVNADGTVNGDYSFNMKDFLGW